MKRVKVTEVLMTIPVEADGDDWDLEIEDELFAMFDLCAQVMAKASGEIDLAVAATLDIPTACTVTIIEHEDWRH